MSRNHILIVFGILVALSPFIGVPYGYLMWILPVLGLLILLVGMSIPKKQATETKEHEATLAP